MTEAEILGPGLRRLRAPNPGPLTGSGTNSYLLGEGRVTVIDPGPEDPAHLAALEAALAPGERIEQVLVTHAHRDHSALARPLAARWEAPVLAYGTASAGRSPLPAALAGLAGVGGGEGLDADFVPDRSLADGEVLALPCGSVTALWTPGHIGNHLCFLWQGFAFSGDHVMGWSSSIVSPPDGDMRAYMASLDRLAAVRAQRLWPGHGEAVEDPAARIAELVAHRRARETAIRAALDPTPQEIAALTRRVYTDTPDGLIAAAERNVLAHLIALCRSGEARAAAPARPGSRPRFVRG